MEIKEYLVDWNKEKNAWLKKNRQVSFETIEVKLLNKDVVEIIPHESEKYSHQFMVIININEYIYVVPFVVNEKDGVIFLKTIIPSRKYTKKYLK